MKNVLCAIYLRLSKEDEDKQQNESESIQNQKTLLIQYALERGWDIYHIYCDEDYSGADSARPDFNKMLEAAKEHKFDIVLCKSQSRFTRDMELVEKYIHGLFPIWGIRFIAVIDNADTDIKGNKKARQINGLVNEWYLEDLSENIRTVFDMKRSQGQYIGGFPIYGYRRDDTDKNRLIIDEEAAEVVRRIFAWALEGRGKQNIATLLNNSGIVNPTRYKQQHGWTCQHPSQDNHGLWNKATVWRILHNEMYTGVMVQGRTRKASYKSKVMLTVPQEKWFRVEGTHEPIIDRATFDAVQECMRLRCKDDGTGERHVLAGLVKCADCGSTMSKYTVRHVNGKSCSYLRCRLYVNSGSQRLCTTHSISLERLTELVSERVRQYVQNWFSEGQIKLDTRKNAHLETLEQEQKKLRSEIEKRKNALKTLYLDKVSGVIEEGQFTEMNAAFLQEKTLLEKRAEQVDEELTRVSGPQYQDDRMQRAKELLKLEKVPRELMVMLIDKIEVGQKNLTNGKQNVTIFWKF